MAQLIPPIAVEEIPVKSERDVAKSLVERLPNDCMVYHSYPWLRLERSHYKSGQQTLQEGEADFLVIWPERGILVLEVKGGQIHFEAQEMQWYSKDFYGRTHKIKDPFKQASKCLHAIEKIIKKKLFSNGPMPFAYGYAVCFPDLVYKGGNAPGSDPNIVIDLSDFLTSKSFSGAISNALNKWNRADKPRIMSKAERKQIERAISPEFKLIAVMSRQIQNQEEQLVRLTDEQYRILDFCQSNHRVAIEGVAGSGKTLLALAQAKRFANEEQATLMLCYNKALAKWIRESLPAEYQDWIHVYHFHGLVQALCRKANIPFSPIASQDFWEKDAADLLSQALSVLPDERFDALVIDEAQDFAPDWWLVIDELNRKSSEGAMYVFYDPRQLLFQPKESIPDMQYGGFLPTNCRNTCEITQRCSEIIQETIKNHPMAPQGDKVENITNPSPNMLAQAIEAKLKDLLSNQGLDPQQIAILSPYNQKNTCLAKLKKINKIAINDDLDAWRSGMSVLMTTVRSFKGLEADCVILLLNEAPKEKGLFTNADYYVACSRAKHILIVAKAYEDKSV